MTHRPNPGKSVRLSGATVTYILTLALPALFLTNCATVPRPLELTYPHEWIDYDGIEGLHETATRVSRHFVKLFVYNDLDPIEVAGAGSGIIVDELGHVVTAAHIVRSSENRAYIKNMNGSTLPAEIIRIDPDNELALLRISIRHESVPPLPVNDQIDQGHKVFAIGTPSTHDAIVTTGTVRATLSREEFRSGAFGFSNPIVLDMHVDTGYSGGPVFDTEGKLIGMVVGYDSTDSGRESPDQVRTTYAIPAQRLYDFYFQWR